jgi:uncharacterized membrane protein
MIRSSAPLSVPIPIPAATLALVVCVALALLGGAAHPQSSASAQEAGAGSEDVAVTVVMFYSPTCPHCHDIITTVLPDLEAEYGDALDLVLINTSSRDGNRLFWDAMEWLAVPEDDQGVPVVIVGGRVLMGGEHSVQRLADVVASAMEEGGAVAPDIPGLAEVVAAQADRPDEPLTVADMSVSQRAAIDPVGTTVALVVLAAMLVSVLFVVDAWRRVGPVPPGGGGWPVWVLPALSLVGLVVAGYLAYSEVTDTRAVCGPIGHCNTVQQSPYAKLFGVLPIGVLGVFGYAVILAVWAWERLGPADLARKTRWAMPLLTLIGVAFSIYLTFLEPFVIGAVCMWCITSAVIMTVLLWTTAPLNQLTGRILPSGRGRAAKQAAGVLPAADLEAADALSAMGSRAAMSKSEARAGRAPQPAAAPLAAALRRLVTALGYAVAALVGLAMAGVVMVYGQAYVFPPPMVTSVAEANQRAAIENAVLVAGIVLGPLAWHVLRTMWSRR